MKIKIRASILTLTLIPILYSGCASAGTKIEKSSTVSIQKGVTTRDQVLALLGPPIGDTLSADGKEMMFWSYSQTKMKGATFIPVVGLFAGGADVKTSSFQVVLNADKIVIDDLWSSSAIEARVGH